MINKKYVQNIVNEFKPQVLENGTYQAKIINISERENAKGTTWLSITCALDEGGLVFVNFYFTEKAHKMAFANIKQLAKEFNIDIDIDEFAKRDMEYLVELFSELIETEVLVHVKGNFGNYNYKITSVFDDVVQF